MAGKYICVHCKRELCQCASPFADNPVLIAMRGEVRQEATLNQIIIMMQRITDNILWYGDTLRDSGQNVPGITDWLPGDRIPQPDTVLVNPVYHKKLGPYNLPIVESHLVPEGMVYLIEHPARWIPTKIRLHGLENEGDDEK